MTDERRKRRKTASETYVEMRKCEHDGEELLVDGQGTVYTFDLLAPRRVGKRLVNGTIVLQADEDAEAKRS
jgi:hypothetical protein